MADVTCPRCGASPPRGEEPVSEPDGTTRVYLAEIDGIRYCHGDEPPYCYEAEMMARADVEEPAQQARTDAEEAERQENAVQTEISGTEG